jgi:GNAT superfamily N-acetyltransferase
MENLGLRWRQMRFNPLRSLTPERLASALDQSAAGWLREQALICEVIEQREAIVRSVMTKRRAAVARRDWQIVMPDPDDPKAEAHKATLEHFYNNLTVTDAADLNVRTGFSGLLRQMMDAIIQRYAVHEIIWKPGADGLTAELRRVPLYFFENRTGKLRFVGPETRADGVDLEEDGWMVTVADGIGEAISICYMYKRMGVQDLLAFSEKFSIPGVLGRTSAKKDSPEGIAMRDSVLAYASEWVGLVYGDDGAIKDPIQVIQTPGAATLPQMTIAEYMDRMIATLVRGGDLSTISRKDSTGSNPQEDETAALLEDDCALVSETLQTQLDRLVIRMVHGDETPAAYIVVNPPDTTDARREIEIDEALARLGVKQKPEDLAERYGREYAEDQESEEEVNRKAAEGAKGREGEEEEMAAENYNPDQARNPAGQTGGGRWMGLLEGIKPSHEYVGGDAWQKDMRSSIRKGEEEIAYADWDYDKFEKIPRIKMIEVSPNYQRKGVGARLVKDIMQSIGAGKVEWTYATPAGDALRQSLIKSGIVFHDPDMAENYNPDQPRVPKGLGDPSGEWTDDPEHAGDWKPKGKKGTESGKLKWKKREGTRVMAPLTYTDDYTISHRPGRHNLTHTTEGKNDHLGEFTTADEAKAAAEVHATKSVVETQSKPYIKPDTAKLLGEFGGVNMPGVGTLQLTQQGEMWVGSIDGKPELAFKKKDDTVTSLVTLAEYRKSQTKTLRKPAANEAQSSDLAQRLTGALSADLQPLGEALAGALQAGDMPAFQAALKKISKRMPEFLESPAMEDLMASEFVKALTQDETEMAENYNPDQARAPKGSPDGGKWTAGGDGGNQTKEASESPTLLEANGTRNPEYVEPVNEIYPGREADVDEMAEDMRKNGWTGRPIGVVGDNAITGSHRIFAARKAGLEEIPVIEIDEETADQFNEWFTTTEESTWGIDYSHWATQDDESKLADISKALKSGIEGLADMEALLRAEVASNNVGKDFVGFKGQIAYTPTGIFSAKRNQ